MHGETDVVVAGGGPAGMMLGLLLARAGVDVTVLEKHADFFRDFRGDTIHPATMDVVAELDLLDAFLRVPHQDITELTVYVGNHRLIVGDFRRLPTRRKCLTLMPQWDFLAFLADEARRYPTFHLRMQAEVTALLEDGGRIAGVRINAESGPETLQAALVVGADGRHSTVRREAGLYVVDRGAPIDVLWFRLSRRPGDPSQVLGRVAAGHVLIMLDRGDYWQCAWVIPKDGDEALRARGLDAFRAEVAAQAPFLADRVGELADWDAVKLLSVRIDRLVRWYRDGLLCIGDAAHAMSPIGGVGINLAIADAVAAANLLVPALRRGAPSLAELAAVQRRRELPADLIQRVQLLVQDRILRPTLGARRPLRAPLLLRALAAIPVLRAIPAYAVGVGVRPEHVRTGAGRAGAQVERPSPSA